MKVKGFDLKVQNFKVDYWINLDIRVLNVNAKNIEIIENVNTVIVQNYTVEVFEIIVLNLNHVRHFWIEPKMKILFKIWDIITGRS